MKRINMWRIAALALIGPVLLHAQAPVRSGARAFAIEAGGGIVGSTLGGLVGIGIARAVGGGCGVDDLACLIKTVGYAGVGSTIGAAVGAIVVGRAASTRPSVLGASLGAVVGAVAGAGVIQLFDEAGVREGAAPVVGYFITQGIVTAIGSRLAARR